MRFSVRWLAATAIVAAMNFGQSAAASTNVNIYNYTSSDSFSLILYKIDDTMTVSISNNNLNNYDIAIQSLEMVLTISILAVTSPRE